MQIRNSNLIALGMAAFACAVTDASAATCEVDFLAGTTTGCSSAPFSVTITPVDGNGDGYFEGCIEVNLDPAAGFSGAQIETSYGAVVSGWTFHVADSITNDGYGGDAGTQSNDAEAYILNDQYMVNANDLGPADLVYRLAFPSMSHRQFVFNVEDQYIRWSLANAWGDSHAPNLKHLFALAGEPDTEGSVNYDIYVCGNRVVGSAARFGRGLERMLITAY